MSVLSEFNAIEPVRNMCCYLRGLRPQNWIEEVGGQLPPDVPISHSDWHELGKGKVPMVVLNSASDCVKVLRTDELIGGRHATFGLLPIWI